MKYNNKWAIVLLAISFPFFQACDPSEKVEEAIEEAVTERNAEQRFDHRKGYSKYNEDLDYGY